ncbi:MAG TPA: hypothetical protein VM577_07345 [Anaerovoracaceae bacterium]|nr:hypothetical protein [Anaerovoracaceae bacterium]
MRRIIFKILIIALFITMAPTQVLAINNNGNSGNATSKSALSKPSIDIYGDNHFASDVNGTFSLSVNAVASVKDASDNPGGGAITLAKVCKLNRVYYKYTITGVDNSNTLPGSEDALTKHDGTKWYDSSCYITNLKPGLYRIRVTFTAYYDGISKAYTASDDATFSVSIAPYSPKITISATPNPALVNKTVTLTLSKVDVDKAFNKNNKIEHYIWTCVNSKYPTIVSSGKTATFVTPYPYGDYQVKCSVQDSAGRWGYDTISINVKDLEPTITLTADSPLAAGQQGNVYLSVDPQGHTFTKYTWAKVYNDGTKDVYSWDGVTFTAPTTSSTGKFTASKAGTYKLALQATDAKTGKIYYSNNGVATSIIVNDGLVAKIRLKSPVIQGATTYAKSISTVTAPRKIIREAWTVVDPNGKSKPYSFNIAGSSVPLNTSILGVHKVTLTITDNTGKTETSTTTCQVVLPSEIITPVTPPAIVMPNTPPDVADLQKPDIPDQSFQSNKVCVDWAHRGKNGPCASSAKVHHLSTSDLKATGSNQEYDTKFQYMKVTVKRWTSDDKLGIVWLGKNGQTPERNGGKDSSYTITFNQVGHYTVHLAQFWYYEYQHREQHTHPGITPRTCSFTEYDGGACIEENGDLNFDVVITFNDVGKPITFDNTWSQGKVDTESYFME